MPTDVSETHRSADAYRAPLAHEPAAPRLRFARSLDDAAPGDMLAVDGTGRIRTAAYIYAQLAFVGCILVFALAVAAMLTQIPSTFARIQSVVMVLMVAHLGRRQFVAFGLWRATSLLTAGRLDEARMRLVRVGAAPLVGRAIRTAATASLGSVELFRGNHAEALAYLDEAGARVPARAAWRRQLLGTSAAIALCSLGRRDEAVARLAAIPPPDPAADYAVVQRWRAEMYLAACGGLAPCTDAELETRIARARRIRLEPGLLALCAWELDRRGQRARSDELRTLALGHPRIASVQAQMPPLGAWIDARAGHAAA